MRERDSTLVKSPSADLSHQLPVTLLCSTTLLYYTTRRHFARTTQSCPVSSLRLIILSKPVLSPSCLLAVCSTSASQDGQLQHSQLPFDTQVTSRCPEQAVRVNDTLPYLLTKLKETLLELPLTHHTALSTSQTTRYRNPRPWEPQLCDIPIEAQVLHSFDISLEESISSIPQPASAKARQSLQLVATKFR